VKKEKETYHYPNFMVTFGHGYDLCIEDNCNKNETSRSNLGSSYELD
jgi:hypothetical protein